MNPRQTHHASILFATGCEPQVPASVSRAPLESCQKPSFEHCVCKWGGAAHPAPFSGSFLGLLLKPVGRELQYLQPLETRKCCYLQYLKPLPTEKCCYLQYLQLPTTQKCCYLQYLQPLETQKCSNFTAFAVSENAKMLLFTVLAKPSQVEPHCLNTKTPPPFRV